MKITIPSPGFGTFKIPDDGTAEASVREALKLGYAHIDTAAVAVHIPSAPVFPALRVNCKNHTL